MSQIYQKSLTINYEIERTYSEKIKKRPVGDVVEKIVGAEELDVDITQLTGAAIDGVAAHLLDVQVIVIAHVDGAPHGGVFAEIAPMQANLLRALQDLDCSQSLQNRRRHIPWKFQPVPVLLTTSRRRR